jgi:hypothetical protein
VWQDLTSSFSSLWVCNNFITIFKGCELKTVQKQDDIPRAISFWTGRRLSFACSKDPITLRDPIFDALKTSTAFITKNKTGEALECYELTTDELRTEWSIWRRNETVSFNLYTSGHYCVYNTWAYPSRQIPEEHIKLDHDRPSIHILSNSLIINNPTIRHYICWATDSVVK